MLTVSLTTIISALQLIMQADATERPGVPKTVPSSQRQNLPNRYERREARVDSQGRAVQEENDLPTLQSLAKIEGDSDCANIWG